MSRIRQILVPIDFSGSADLALEYAADLARRYSAELHLVHVLEDPILIGGSADGFIIDPPGLRARMAEDARRLLEQTLERCTRPHVRATREVVFGKTAASINDLALARRSDLIVMGTHGRSGLAHLMLGSVAERVVRSAPCPVLTVRATLPQAVSNLMLVEPAVVGA